MNLSVSNKKTILLVIAILLLGGLFVGVFYSFMFMQNVLTGVAGDAGGTQGAAIKFELQKAIDIGVVPEE